jgi:hypothetical protein
MKRIFYALLLTSISLWSCKSRNDKSSTNDLIPNEIQVKYESLITLPESSEIFTSLDKTDFAAKLVSTTLAGKINVYDPFDTAKVLSKDEIKAVIGSWQDTVVGVNEKQGDTALIIRQFGFDKTELKKLLFTENWHFNSQTFTLTKTVKSWCPVKVYYKEDDTAKTDQLKKMLFLVKQKTGEKHGKCTLIKENVTTEFSLYNETVPEWLADLNPKRFMNILLDNIVSKKVVAYDFFDQKKKLSIEDVKTNMGECTKLYSVENPKTDSYDTLRINSKMDLDEVKSIIFVEDWYIDWETLAICKTVKSVAPVRVYTTSHNGEDDEIEKKIAFIVHLNNK